MKKRYFSVNGLLVCLAVFLNSAQNAQAFDANADCATQPYGLSVPLPEGETPSPSSDEVFAEVTPDKEPNYVPSDELKDIFVELARPILHEQADLMADAMQGICLSKRDRDLHVSLYFKDRFSLKLKPFHESMKMEMYQVDLPTVLRVVISKSGKFVSMRFSGRRYSAAQLLVNVPVLSNRVYLHRIILDTETQWMRISANVMKDHVGIVAWSHFEPGKPILAQISFVSTLGRLFRPRTF